VDYDSIFVEASPQPPHGLCVELLEQAWTFKSGHPKSLSNEIHEVKRKKLLLSLLINKILIIIIIIIKVSERDVRKVRRGKPT
jgi:hypothetical protein